MNTKDHIFKDGVESWKYGVQQSIFDELQTLSWVFNIIVSIESKTREKKKLC